MVSLASAALKTPSVSYAERAKSGYSVRSSKDSQDASRQRSVHPVATSGLITSTSSQARTAESNASSGSVEAPNRTFNSNSGPPSDSLTENADDAHVSKRSTSTQVSQTVGQGAPVGNVWAARLREKAQAQALAQNFPQSLPTPSSMQLSLYTPSSSSPFTTAHNPPGTTQMPSVVPVARSNAPSINSAQSDLDADVDPFVVRMPSHLSRASSAALPVAPTDDIWPEVGAASTQAVHSRIYSGEPARESNEPSSSRKDGSSSSDQVAGPKKSEKTKWVPIPPKELQAAFDAIRSPARSASPEGRYLSPHLRDRSARGLKGLSGTGGEIFSGSHTPSYSAHSSSASQSAVHSQSQSRSGSLRSSPRLRARAVTVGEEVSRSVSGEGRDSSRGTSSHRHHHTHTSMLNGHAYPLPARGPPRMSGKDGMPFFHLPLPIPLAIDLSRHPSHRSSPTSPTSYPYAFQGLNGLPNHVPGASSPPFLHGGYHVSPGSGATYPVFSPYPAYGYGQANPYWSSYPLQPDLYRASAGLSSSSIQPELSGSSEVATGHSARIHVRRSSKEEQPESLVPAKARSDSLQGSQTVEPKKPRRTMVFGSIGDSDTRSPSPPEAKPSCGANDAESSDARANDHPIELFPAFSIGVSAGETGPSWSGSRNHLLKFTQRPDGSTADLTNRATLEAPGVGEEQSSDRADSDAPSPKAEISEPRTQATKWEFGTTRHYDITDELHSLPGQQEPEETTLLLDESSREQQQVDALAAPTHRSGSTTKPRVAANGYQVRTTSPLSPSQAGPSLAGCEEESTTSDVWEVKDYGYGFGDVSGSEHAMEIIRQEMLARERQRILDGQKELAKVEQERERERAREMLERERERKEREWEKEPEWERMREQERVTGRPRRGSFTGSYNSYDRGNFRGRRGRGFGGRPFGNRHLGRGGYQHQKLASMPHITPPPFQVNPAASLANHISAYSQPSLLTGYISPTLDPYLPVSATIHPQTGLPVTMAHSMSPFSDTTRTYLLTQLEYYLSPQNMAQDFFLRQRMDDSGWIPISLLASFNRVRNLTTDVALVAEVLRQSNMAEVEGDWVRMSGRQWEQFVLPSQHKNAAQQPDAKVTEFPTPEDEAREEEEHQSSQVPEHEAEVEDVDGYVDDEDEEDVVFVIGEEAEGSWMPERRQP